MTTVEVMMEIASWSTADVVPRRHFEYWNDLVAKVLCCVSVAQPLGHNFDATNSTRRITREPMPAYKCRRKSIMAALTSGARSCSVQCPQPGSVIVGRTFGTRVDCWAMNCSFTATTKSRVPAM